jgi:tetratricopeptide (TPR) repeat protein
VAAFCFIPPRPGRAASPARADPVAKAAPPDATLYVGINLLNATPEKVDPIISAFNDAYKEYTGEDVGDSADMMDQVDDALRDFDMTVEDDILPWVGQYAGMGVLNLQIDDYGSPENVDYFIAIEARDRGRADDFLLKLSDEVGQSWDVNVDSSEYQGATIYSVDDEWQPLAFSRAGNLVILANSEDTIQDLIDAQKGDSLAEDAVYSRLIRQLPANRLVTFYIPASALEDLTGFYTDLMGGIGRDIGDIYASTTGMAFSLSIIDAGLQMDGVVAYDPAQMSDIQRQMLEAAGRASPAADILPADSYAFVTGQRLDLMWDFYQEALSAATDGDFDEALEALENEIGINPGTDIFHYLNQAFVMGVFPSDEGLFAEQADVDIGFLLAAQVSDEGAMLNTLDDFNDALENLGGAEINDASSGGMVIFEAEDTWVGEPMLAYGVGQGWFGLANSTSVLESLPNQGNPLSRDPLYRAAQGLLPGGVSPVMYVNIESALEEISAALDDYDRDSFEEATFFLRPIQYLIAGGGSLSGDTVRSTYILAIPTR